MISRIILVSLFFLSSFCQGSTALDFSKWRKNLNHFPYAPEFTFSDIAYSKGAYVLLSNDKLYAFSTFESEPTVIDLNRWYPFLETGNRLYMVAGGRGYIASSRDLRTWRNFRFSGDSVDELIEGNALIPHEQQVPFIEELIFKDGRFHVLNASGEYTTSIDGIHWTLVEGDSEDSFPKSRKIEETDESIVFQSNGEGIRFDLNAEEYWKVSEKDHSGNWVPTGVFIPLSRWDDPASWRPTQMVHDGKNWFGLFDDFLFRKSDGIWKVYRNDGYDEGFHDVAYTSERSSNTFFLGVNSQGLFSSQDGDEWSILNPDIRAQKIVYVPQNGFFLVNNVLDQGRNIVEGIIQQTFNGIEFSTVFSQVGFKINDVVKVGKRLVVTGEGETLVQSTGLPLNTNGGLPSGEVVWTEYQSGIDLDTTIRNETTLSVPLVVAGMDHGRGVPEEGILTTENEIYRRSDDRWVKVKEVDEYSWVTAAYRYRGRYYVGTTNWWVSHRLSGGPPDGIALKDSLLHSSDGISWEEIELDFQPHILNVSTDGPYFLSYNPREFRSKTLSAYLGTDLSVASQFKFPGGIFVWAKGKYHMFGSRPTETSQFMGFEDEWFHMFYFENALGEVSSDTRGWFGRCDPVNYPILKHSVLGEIEFHIDDKDVIHVFSNEFGVLKTSRKNVPYFESLVDGNTYYVDFEGGRGANRFYNHQKNAWVDAFESEDFDYAKWYQLAIDQVVLTQQKANSCVVAVQESQVIDAYRLIDDVRFQHKIALQYIRSGNAREDEAMGTNPTYKEWPLNSESFDHLIQVADDALEWAENFYETNM